MRWRQKYNKATGKSTFIPIDGSAAMHDAGAAIHGDIEPFVSPVDGTVISDRKQLREHNKRNDVVNSQEFSQQWLDKKAKERQDFFDGKLSRKETQARKEQLNETINRAEKGLPY